MKSINNIKQEKKIDNKIFLSLLKLLETPIKEDEKLKNEILFKETEDGTTLFNYLLQKCLSQIKSNFKKEEPLIDIDIKENNDNEKFICLENIKEEKKEDTSEQELIEISNTFILKCFEGTKDPKLISELLKIINLLKNSKKKKW